MRNSNFLELLVPIVLGIIIIVFGTIHIYNADGVIAKRYVDDAGYYCKYCHQGVSISQKYSIIQNNWDLIDTALKTNMVIKTDDLIVKPYPENSQVKIEVLHDSASFFDTSFTVIKKNDLYIPYSDKDMFGEYNPTTIEEIATESLKYTPCPCSKNHMHKLKWYDKSPNELHKYIE